MRTLIRDTQVGRGIEAAVGCIARPKGHHPLAQESRRKDQMEYLGVNS